jgi:hypothetical protein
MAIPVKCCTSTSLCGNGFPSWGCAGTFGARNRGRYAAKPIKEKKMEDYGDDLGRFETKANTSLPLTNDQGSVEKDACPSQKL